MFKKHSPLKHKESGPEIPHNTLSEEDHEEIHGGEIDEQQEPTTEEQVTKAITPTIGTQEDLTEFSKEYEAEKTQKIQKANQWMEDNNRQVSDYNYADGVYTRKKDGSRVYVEDEDYDPLMLSTIKNPTLFNIVKENDSKQANKEQIGSANERINNFITDNRHNANLLKNPLMMDPNTAVASTTAVNAVNSGERVVLDKQQSPTALRDIDASEKGEKNFTELWTQAKVNLAKIKGVNMFDIPDDDPELEANFRQLAIGSEAQGIYNTNIKDAAIKASKEEKGKYLQRKDDKKDIDLKGLETAVVETEAKEAINEYKAVEQNLKNNYDAITSLSSEDSEAGKRINELNKENDKILSKKYKTQEEVDEANERIQANYNELKGYQNQYNKAYNSYSQAFEAYNTQNSKALKLNETAEGLKSFQKERGKDHGLFSKAEKNLMVGALSMTAAIENAAYKSPITAWAYQGILNQNPEWKEGRDKFEKNIRKAIPYISEQIGATSSYEDIFDSWYNLGDYVTNTTAQAAPLIASMVLLKNPKVAMGMMYAYGAGDKYYEMDEEIAKWKKLNPELADKKYGKYSTLAYHGIPFLSGTAVAASERFTFGRVQALKSALRNKGPLYKGVLNSAKQSFKPTALVKGGKDMVGEGGTEWIDGVAQKWIKKDLQGDQSIHSIIEGTDHDFMSGVTVSGMLFRMPTVGMNMLRGYQSGRSQKEIDNNIRRQNEISTILNSGKVGKETRSQLHKELGELTVKNHDILRQDVGNLNHFSRKEKETLTGIEVEKSKLRVALKDLQLNSNLDNQTKKVEAQKLKDKYYELDGAKEKLINVYNRAQRTKEEEEINTETVKKHSKKVFGDNIEVVSATSQQNSAELMEISLRERKVAILEEHTRQNTPLTQEAQAEINQINDDLARIQDINKKPGQQSLAGGALTAYGYITPRDQGGRQKIILNNKAALKDGFVTTAQHEFLHAITHETLKNDPKVQKAMGEALSDYMAEITTESLAGSELAERMKGYTFDEGVFNEEKMNLLSEAMVRENLPFKKEAFEKVKDFKRRFYQNYLGKEIEFNTGKDVYNFLKDYNHSIKTGRFSNAITSMAREGASGTLIEDAVSKGEQVKMSREASDNVQRIYKEQGTAGAFDIIDQFKPIVNKLVERRREAPGFDRQLLMDEIETGKRGMYDLIQDYNPESGVPLAAYINKYLPSRAIEASKRVLGEEFTEDITERVDIADEGGLPTFEEVSKPKRRKVMLADSFDVGDKVRRSINKRIKDIDINKITFKNTPDLTQNIVGELFGINPKKLQTGANMTKGELQSAQMFINKNADLLRNMLPEGATASGTSTGVQNVLLKAFYDKTARTTMAKTGSKAGLPIQIKNPNIDRKDFLEVFGIIDGKPIRDDRNTSARVLALARQTSRMMSNQAIREKLIKDESHPAHMLGLIEDGKSKFMFSEPAVNLTAKQLQEIGRREKALEDREMGENLKNEQKDYKQIVADYVGQEYVIDNNTPEGRKKFKQLFYSDLFTSILPESFFRHSGTYTGVTKKVIDTAEGIAQYRRDYARNLPYINTFELNNAVDGVKKVMEQDGRKFAKPDKDIENAMKRLTYGDLAKKFVKGELKAFNKSKRKGFKKIWEKLDSVIQQDPTIGIPVVSALLSSTSAHQGHFMRTGSPAAFYNTLKGRNVEEHTEPASDLGKFLLNRSAQGNLQTYYDAAVESYFQGSLPKIYDDKLVGENFDYSENIPLEHMYDVLMGNKSVWIRYFNPNVNNNNGGIDPNVIKLENGNTIAQEFGVAVDAKLLTSEVIAKQQELLFEQFNGETSSADATKAINSFANLNFDKNITGKTLFSKAVRKSRTTKEPKGITVLDFDDTLATTKSKVLFTAPDGTKGSLNAEQYASTYQDLAEQGYKFDFSEFNIVVGGETAPLFNKALKLSGKFGTKDMFILTARPPAAQSAIHTFLKAQGLNIPIKNITGLGNSTSEAKALWMADKVGEGYNDFYFADDALQNIQAVQNMLDQFDVKSKIQQAKVKFSQALDPEFNKILEQTSGVTGEKVFSKAKAELRGKGKGRFRWFIPSSAEDFKGLIYSFLGKGKQGDKHMDFFKKALLDPYARGYRELNSAKQVMSNDYNALRKGMPDVRKKLSKKIPGQKDFRFGDAARVYLWDKAGFEIPGLSKTDKSLLIETVNNDPTLQSFSDAVGLISKRTEGYVKPAETWLTGNILSDLDGANKVSRKEFLAEWIENKDVIFSDKNLNKIEAIHGPNFREALEDMLYRMENGTNRTTGNNRLVNAFQNWVNNSVGAIMFFNARSAVLQTLSSVNFINWGDNNIAKASARFADQPQFWKDFSTLFNSDMLKQRRKGLKTDVNHAELAEAVGRSKDPASAALNWLLQKGFLPTQIADSFAISSGGATFYRNRIKTYLKEGLSQKEAETKAFEDFQEIAEATQQSSRPDLISQQQASTLGRLILAFQNTPMQYMRLTKRAIQDLAKGRGDAKTNISRIIYYGAIQNVIFYSLQSALFALAFDDDEEEELSEKAAQKKMRILNGSLDTILRGTGVGGAIVSTIKNMLIKIGEEQGKGWNKDFDNVVVEALQLSPPIGSKVRKLRSAGRSWSYNEDVIKEMNTFDLDNPVWESVGNVVSATTNIPMDRLVNKTKNVRAALDEDSENWQRVALMLGWNRWDLGVKSDKIEQVKTIVKEKKKVKAKEKAKIKKEEEKKVKEQALEDQIEKEKTQQKEGKLKDPKCRGVRASGERCGISVSKAGDYCTIHEKVEQSESGKQVQCKGKRTNGKRCGMKTTSKSGYCYYHD